MIGGMRMAEQVKFKPHHFIDIIMALGEGEEEYTPDLDRGNGLHIVAEKVLKNPDIMIKIEVEIDDICKPCRFTAKGVCSDKVDPTFHGTTSKYVYNKQLDEKWMNRLGMKQGDELTARAFCELLKEKAGDFRDLYPYSTPEQKDSRQKNLQVGIEKYLKKDVL